MIYNKVVHIDKRTLKEILIDVIRLRLEWNSNNQSKTARDLGISRITLRKYMKLENIVGTI